MSAKPTIHRSGVDVGGPGAILAPGNTSQRPTDTRDGLTRVNTELKRIEFTVNNKWFTLRDGDGYYATIVDMNKKLDANAKAVDSDLLDGYDHTHFARAAQVLTDVPEGAVFTDTQTPVINTLTSDSAVDSLSARQGKVLKTLIDNIHQVLLTDDTSLDELQELVDFIKQNKEELDSLAIANIAGLNDALDSKLDNDATAVNSTKLNGQLASYYEDIVSRLGYTPVEQGGGNGQSNKKINIGWSDENDNLRLEVDGVDHASNWPIKAYNAGLFDGQSSSYYAKSSQVLTDVPAGAVFTDTWRPVLDVVTSTSTGSSASANAVRVAYNKGTEALAKANTKLDANAKAVDSDKLDGNDSTYFAKASQVLTNVPAGAVFTDTQVDLSDVINSTSSIVAASSKAVKTAYDKGAEALVTAKLKLGFNEKAVDSDKLDGHDSTYFAKASQVLTNVPAGAVFTDTQRGVSDTLTSTSTSVSLTANQGRVLKTMIDNLASIISSDDNALDEIQEIVDYIKQNREELESLSISNIAGLQTALDNRLGITSKAVDSDKLDGHDSTYFAKSSQVLTNVPTGAVFTDTWRPVSDSTSSTSTTTGASLNAVKKAYDRGNAGYVLADTKLTEGDPLAGVNGLSYWVKSYPVSTGVSKKITEENGQPLSESKVYRVSCRINSTGTNNGLVGIIYNVSGVWNINLTVQKGSGSNHVVLELDDDGDPSLTIAHTTTYSIVVYHESILGSATSGSGSAEIFGADGYLENINGAFYFKKKRVFHQGHMGSGSGLDADLLDGQHGSYYAKASQVLTNVPTGAVFTDTWRPVSDSVTSTSTSTGATSKAAKTAYDRGTSALNVANTKLDSGATAVDSNKLNGQSSTYYAKASQVLTNVPAGAKFTDTQRSVSDSVTSTSTSVAANSKAVKTAYDKGVEALNKANEKIGTGDTASDADKFDGQPSSYYAKSSQVLTNVPVGAKFTDTNTWRGVVNSLTSTSTSDALTANQGRILKGLIDNINSILSSDDTSLDELQELVEFIKQNKEDLDSLSIANISGLQTALNGKLGTGSKAADSDKLDGHDSTYFAKASQVLTDVPAGAKFTDTNTHRSISDSVTSTSTSVSASSKAVKTAYDRGTSALNVANGKLDENATAADSDKLDGHDSTYFAKASQVLTDVPAGAKFTDTQRTLSSSVTSTSTSQAATSSAVKTAYDRGTSALNTANSKLGATAKAVDSAKLDGKSASSFVQTTGDQSVSGVKTFNEGVSLGGGSLLSYDSATDSIVFSFT